MFDENNAKQLILRILQIPIPEQVTDQTLKFAIFFFQNKKKALSSKTIKSLESNSSFSGFLQVIFGDDVKQGNCSFPWLSLSIIDIKLKSRLLSENDLKVASLFTFYASIQWLTVFESKNAEDNTISDESSQKGLPFLPDTSLFDALLSVSSMNKSLVQYSLSLFCLIFTRVTSILPSVSVKTMERSASKFLSSVTSTDAQTLHLVEWASLINEENKKGYQESEKLIMSQPLRMVLELIMQAIQLLPNYFSIDDVQKIYEILRPFALDSCIDPFSLNLATILSPFLGTNETDQIFQSGVAGLMKRITSIQPFVNFEGLGIEFNSTIDNSHNAKDSNDNLNLDQNINEKTNSQESNLNQNENSQESNLNQNENEARNSLVLAQNGSKQTDSTNETKSENFHDSLNKVNEQKKSSKNSQRSPNNKTSIINKKRLFIERGDLDEKPFFISENEFTSSHEIIAKIPDDIKSIASLLKHTIESSSHLNCELFPSQIEELCSDLKGQIDSDSLWSILIVLLFLCENSHFEEQSLCEFFRFIITNTSLFNSKYSIFTESGSVCASERSNLGLFISLRFYAIQIFISPSQISCFQLYWKQISSGIFANRFGSGECAKFAEFFTFMASIKLSSLIASVLPICISDTYFAALGMSEPCIVLVSLKKLVNSVFKQENKNRSMVGDFFMNSSFLDFLFAAIFDSYFSGDAMEIVSHCFTRFSEKISPRIADSFNATEELGSVEFVINNQDEISYHMSVLYQLFELVIDLLLNHSEKASLFIPLFQSSYRSMKNLSSLWREIRDAKMEISETLQFAMCQMLHSFIKFASIVSYDEKDDLSWTGRKPSSNASSNKNVKLLSMQKTALDGILEMIGSVEGEEPSTPCFSALVFAASSGKSSSLRAEFLISRPSFLSITIRAFSKSSRLSGVLRFIGSLCEFSTANSRACHVGGLDIDLVGVVRSNAHKSMHAVKDALKLFAQIAQVASSTAAVASFMTCFHCIDESYKLSPVTEPALSTLDQILAKGSQTPAAFLPAMNELPCIRIEGLTECDIYNGFTIVAWVFIDGGSQDSPFSIISIQRASDAAQQSKEALLTVIVQLGRVFVSNGRFLGGKDAIVLDDSVPTDRWTMIAVTFENSQIGQRSKSCEFRIKSFISNKAGQANQKVIPIEVSQSRSKLLTCTSCGSVEGGSGLEHPALVASVTLFQALKSISCLEIVQNGLLLTRSNTEGSAVSIEVAKKLPPPLFSAVIESENSVLCINSSLLKKQKASKVSLGGRPVVQQMPFADVFARFFTASSLLPVFALLALPSSQSDTRDKAERNRSISSCAVRVLFRSLQMSPAASCREFVAFGGFKIAAFILSCIPECLTQDLFSQFAAFARESSSIEVRKSTADEVIFNESLWRLADKKTQFFVIQQWIGLAYDSQKGNSSSHAIETTRSLSSYLPPTVLFFWVSENDADIRELMMNSIIIRAASKLTQQDLSAFTSVVMCTDNKITLDFLYVMKQIALMPNSLSSLSDADFFPLHSLLKRGSIQVICELVGFIIAIHSSRMQCRFTLSDHLVMAANEISNIDSFSAEEASKIVELAESNPDVFTVMCAVLAATIQPQKTSDNTQQLQALEGIFTAVTKTQRHLDVGRDWAFWPFYAALKLGGHSKISTAKFALKSASDLTDLFSQSVVSSATAGDESGSVCREVLLQAGMELLLNRIGGKAKSGSEQNPRVSEDVYVVLCFYFIFFYGRNRSLTHMLMNEGVRLGLVEFNSKMRETDSLLTQTPFACFKGCSSVGSSFNIDQDSNWCDKELSLQCVQVIVKRKIVKYANLALFLLSYLSSSLPEPSSTLLQELRTIAAFEEPFASLLMSSIKQQSHIPVDKTRAFESLLDLFGDSVSFVQSAVDSCVSRLSTLMRKFKDEEKVHPSPPKFSKEVVKAALNEERQNSRHLWRSVWRRMTFDCAPWHCSLSCTKPTRRWKRDETLCTSCLIPAKMKVNYKFDDHNEASLGRELGNIKLAREQNEESKRRRKEASLCPDLLETGSFDDDENQKKKRDADQEADNDSSQSQSNSKSRLKVHNLASLSHGLGFDTATRFFKNGLESSPVPILSISCQRIRVSRTRDCLFVLYSNFISLQFAQKTISFPIGEITRLFLRAPLHHQCGIEIITKKGTSFFIVFPEGTKNADIASAIARQAPISVRSSIQTIKSADFFASHSITQLWCNRKMSNFEYLMSLNIYSGRSFSQLSMYPFLPWILVDYESKELDLSDAKSFRDLSMPVGKLGAKRLESLRKRAMEMREFGNDPFLYSSYAVSPLIVILWMMRVEPFTTLHIEMQSGKFDHAARQFASIPDAFRMVQSHLNDFRELIPEFFFSKSFLVNENRFDLGIANENQVDDVLLPPWASKNALKFVYVNRKALESERVSEHLNEWIDLIWGFKQRGKEAEEADNTYDPAIYSDVWTEEALNDPDRRSLVDQTMTHCGQIPDQLFTSPHPPRNPSSGSKNEAARVSSVDGQVVLDGESILFGTARQIRDSSSPYKFELVLLKSSGRFIDVVVECSDSSLSVLSSQPLMKGLALDVDEATSFSLFSLDEVAFGTASGKVFVVDAKQCKVSSAQPHAGIVNCVASSAPFIVSGGADTVIACNEKKEESNKLDRVHSVPAYSSEVSCVSVSREFHAVASATMAGQVIVQSLESGAVLCVIELGDRQETTHLLITRAWGFVVVFTDHKDNEDLHEVHVFTLCGELVGRTETGARAARCLTWASHDGFDFVAAAFSDGRIAAFEAFFVGSGLEVVAASPESGLNGDCCTLPQGFGSNGDDVVVMSYSIECGTFVAITKSGRVSIIRDFFIKTDRIR